MRIEHVNEASISGVVQAVAMLHRDPGGFPTLEFTVNSSPSPTAHLSFDRTHSHRCIAYGARAERLSATLGEGTHLEVRGEIRVNAEADTDLRERIARISVDVARLLPSCKSSFLPSIDPFADYVCSCGSNDVRLAGKVLALVSNRLGARVTLRTRALTKNTHHVWATDGVLPERLRVGSPVRIRGHLNHILRDWEDGQVRLVSGVYATSFEIVRRESSTSVVHTAAPLAASVA